MSEPAEIRTTTPAWLRIPALLLLIAVSVYFLAGYHYALEKNRPAYTWMGVWSMFTTNDTWHMVIEGEALRDGEWHTVDLEALFPYRWESGPRYVRRSVYGSRSRLRAFAVATCGRMQQPAEAVRYRRLKWKRTLGSFEQPKKRLRTEDLGTFRCERGQP